MIVGVSAPHIEVEELPQGVHGRPHIPLLDHEIDHSQESLLLVLNSRLGRAAFATFSLDRQQPPLP